MDTNSNSQPLRRAAIQIGASTISCLITETSGTGSIRSLDHLVQSTSIGHDIFSKGLISPTTVEKTVKTLQGYLKVIQDLGVEIDDDKLRIVATNLLSETSNADIFTNRIQIACGYHVEVLDDGEMTRLIYQKTRRRLKDTPIMKEKTTLVVHVGPGNTRVLLFRKGKIEDYNSYRFGSSRLTEEFRADHLDEAARAEQINDRILSKLENLAFDYQRSGIEEIVCIGHEIQRIAQFIDIKDSKCTTAEFEALCEKVRDYDDDKIVQKFNIDYQTAETISSALHIYLNIIKSFQLNRLYIAGSNYDKGLLQDLHQHEANTNDYTEEVIGSAWTLAKKYQVNKAHATQVCKLSLRLFDQLQELHQLNPVDRNLLEIASIVHEVGNFITPVAHHKHSQYIILNSDLFGVSRHDLVMIALIARYHRNSNPKKSHSYYRELSIQDQIRVSKLSAILRLADALDRTHASKVTKLKINVKNKKVELLLKGVTDASIERAALRTKGTLFQNIFGLTPTIIED